MRYHFEKEGYPIFRCDACSFECIHPQPDDSALAAIYDRSYFDIYGKDSGINEKDSDRALDGFRKMKQRSFESFMQLISPVPAGSRLVDCGAGTGFLVDYARGLGLDAYAIEFSDYGAAECRKIAGPGHVFQGEVEQALFEANPDNRYETVMMIDFIEHVRDPRSVLLWAAAHLTPKGNLLVVTPGLGGVSHRVFGRHWPNYYPEHLWYFSRKSLSRLLVECGFTVQAVRAAVKFLSPQYIINRHKAYQYHALIGVPCMLADKLLPGGVKNLNIPLRTGDILIHASI
jgi:SAM-dependent methyltransferase